MVSLVAFNVPTSAAQGTSPEPGYLDDRSPPEAVISSYYDAVNKHEFRSRLLVLGIIRR